MTTQKNFRGLGERIQPGGMIEAPQRCRSTTALRVIEEERGDTNNVKEYIDRAKKIVKEKNIHEMEDRKLGVKQMGIKTQIKPKIGLKQTETKTNK